MFLLTNKALIWVGKGQKKKKPIIITTWAVWRGLVLGMSTKNRQTKQVRAVPGRSLSYKNKGFSHFWKYKMNALNPLGNRA